MAEDYSYVGSGIVLIAPYGTEQWEELGNTFSFKISPQTDTKTLPDRTNPGGGIYNRIDRVNDWTLDIQFSDINAANVARYTRGKASDIVSGTATDEARWSYKGKYVPLKYPATAVSAVEPHGGGTAYAAGTDYILDRGMLFIPATSTIADATSAANIDVTYTYGALAKVEAAVAAQQMYSLQLRSVNEARGGKRVVSHCHKVNGGLLNELELLAEDYAQPSVSQSILKDPTKQTDSNTSAYFYWLTEK